MYTLLQISRFYWKDIKKLKLEDLPQIFDEVELFFDENEDEIELKKQLYERINEKMD